MLARVDCHYASACEVSSSVPWPSPIKREGQGGVMD